MLHGLLFACLFMATLPTLGRKLSKVFVMAVEDPEAVGETRLMVRQGRFGEDCQSNRMTATLPRAFTTFQTRNTLNHNRDPCRIRGMFCD